MSTKRTIDPMDNRAVWETRGFISFKENIIWPDPLAVYKSYLRKKFADLPVPERNEVIANAIEELFNKVELRKKEAIAFAQGAFSTSDQQEKSNLNYDLRNYALGKQDVKAYKKAMGYGTED